MRCYWLLERPIGILVLIKELLDQASTNTYPVLLLVAQGPIGMLVLIRELLHQASTYPALLLAA
jgi:hypothetical protein